MAPAATNDSSDKLERLEKKVAQNPGSPVARTKLGMALLRNGSTKRAEEEFNTAVELDPSYVPAMVNLGGLYLSRWDFKRCVEINRRAAACEPDVVETHYNQGLGHLYQAEPKEMVDCFKRVISLDENHPGGHYHLAVGLLSIGERDAAKKELAIAMKLGYKPEPTFLKEIGKSDSKASPGNKENKQHNRDNFEIVRGGKK